MKFIKTILILIIIGVFIWIDISVFKAILSTGENGIYLNGHFIPFNDLSRNKIEDYAFLSMQTLFIAYISVFKVNEHIYKRIQKKHDRTQKNNIKSND